MTDFSSKLWCAYRLARMGSNENLNDETCDCYKLAISKMLQHLHNLLMGSMPPLLCSIVMSRPRLLELENGNKQRGEFNSNVNNGGENVLWRMAPSWTSCLRVATDRVGKNHSNKDRNNFDLGNSQVHIEKAYRNLTMQFPENVTIYKKFKKPFAVQQMHWKCFTIIAHLWHIRAQPFP